MGHRDTVVIRVDGHTYVVSKGCREGIRGALAPYKTTKEPIPPTPKVPTTVEELTAAVKALGLQLKAAKAAKKAAQG